MIYILLEDSGRYLRLAAINQSSTGVYVGYFWLSQVNGLHISYHKDGENHFARYNGGADTFAPVHKLAIENIESYAQLQCQGVPCKDMTNVRTLGGNSLEVANPRDIIVRPRAGYDLILISPFIVNQDYKSHFEKQMGEIYSLPEFNWIDLHAFQGHVLCALTSYEVQ